MSNPDQDVAVVDKPESKRYEITVDGQPAGFAEYTSRPGVVVFTHTVIDDAFEGRGLGSALASGALDDARRRGLSIEPQCSFITHHIERHPEYADLVHRR